LVLAAKADARFTATVPNAALHWLLPTQHAPTPFFPIGKGVHVAIA